MAHAKLPAMAAGTLFRRRKSPQVFCRNLPARAGNLRETFIVRVRAEFLKSRDASFYPVPNTLTQVTFAAFEVNGKPFKFDYVPKNWTVHCLLFNPLSKKYIKSKVFHYRQNDGELAVVTFDFFHNSRVKE